MTEPAVHGGRAAHPEDGVVTDAATFRTGPGRQRPEGQLDPPASATDSGYDGLLDPRDDSDTLSISTCSSSDGGEVPLGVKAVLGAAVDSAASMGPAMTIESITVENSTCRIGNNMHVHGPLTVVVSERAVAAGAGQGIVLSASNLGLKDADAQDAVKEGAATALPPKETPEQHKEGTVPRRWWRSPCAALVATGLAVAVVILATMQLGKVPGGGPGHMTEDPLTSPPPTPIPLPHGVQYVPKDQWRARPAKTGTRLRTPVDTVIVCHTGTASCSSAASCSTMVRGIQGYNMVDNGWDDIAYNFLVGGDGRVYEGRGWDTVGSFLYGWNSRSLGVAVIGSFTEDMPPADQRRQLASLLEWGVDLGKIKPQYRLVGACQLQSTKSPGLRFMQDLRTWSRWWDNGAERCSD
ncbi:uncharacterized protein LOC117653749 [Thrips palmi]|uniref:Uncharacterized protein LOC117653749 n=1 Tax=Thrips palmi TaxID=161013 RepID=A0A6P9AJ80_THRPL|nr:uncharacterized protein LOC117653749 [Thrips palmi]